MDQTRYPSQEQVNSDMFEAAMARASTPDTFAQESPDAIKRRGTLELDKDPDDCPRAERDSSSDLAEKLADMGIKNVDKSPRSGGMADVSLWDFDGETMLVKSVKESFRTRPDIVEDFWREYEIQCHLSPLLDEAIAEPYFAMNKKMEGERYSYSDLQPPSFGMRFFGDEQSLADSLVEDKWTVGDAMDYLSRTLDALVIMHDEGGVIHGDLKPGNLLVRNTSQGRYPVVIDFGLASFIGEYVPVEDGVLKGSLSYASPQQFKQEEPSVQDDIYSFGVIAYEMFTGKRVINGMKDLLKRREILEQIRAEIHEELGVCNPIADVIMGCIEYDDQDRFKTMSHVKRAFDKARFMIGSEDPDYTKDDLLDLEGPPIYEGQNTLVSDPSSDCRGTYLIKDDRLPPTLVTDPESLFDHSQP